jgi:transcriptional regulator with XRE-family HTH domain
MDMQAQITIRAKKLGILIRDARIASRRSTKECAAAIKVTNGVFKAYEEGRKAPSLPELESLVYYLELPIDHFWSNKSLSDAPERINELNLPRLTGLRQLIYEICCRTDRHFNQPSKAIRVGGTPNPLARIGSYPQSVGRADRDVL